MSIREKFAKETYEFVHRGKTHMSWEELPFKYGKKAYREFSAEILSLLKAEIEKYKLTDEEEIQAQKDYIKRTYDQVKVVLDSPLRGWRRNECLLQAQLQGILKLLEDN